MGLLDWLLNDNEIDTTDFTADDYLTTFPGMERETAVLLSAMNEVSSSDEE